MSTSPTITITTTSEAQTVSIGESLAALLVPGDIVALHGDLGAGKTRLVRGIAIGLGHDPAAVSSPTYVLMNEYDDPAAHLPLVHVDAYRLKSADDLDAIGWDRVVNADAVVVVEWAERIANALPAKRFDIAIEHGEGDTRTITISSPSATRPLEGLRSPNAPRPCRICGTMVTPDVETFPFCSARCRQIDLGQWLSGGYTISRELKDRDLEEGV